MSSKNSINHSNHTSFINSMNGVKMERLRTLTIANWQADADDDDDDDDDRFFESFDRMSTVDFMDAPSPSSSSDFDECRISFASAVSPSTARFHSFSATDLYDVWMSAPGSITERRNRLLQGMGLVADKPHSNSNPVAEASPGAASRASPVVVMVRSRSEGDIESSSIEKQRKAEMVDVPKQRMTRRTYSAPHHPRLVGPTGLKESASSSSSSSGRSMRRGDRTMSSFGAFFLIKNLDTGKEFIVNEYGEDGAWNRLSDLQTGKQLTMEEFEKCVGFSPVVKELMRRENVSRIGAVVRAGGGGGQRKGGGIGFSANSYLYKSLRTSKRRSVALLKSGIKGMAHSVSGLISDKDHNTAEEAHNKKAKTPTAASSNTSGAGWIKARQSGKSQKELSALHLCQEIQAHQGSIWSIKFSADARFLGSAGEDRIVQVWEVQECQVMSLLPPEKKSKKSSSGGGVPEYVQVPETVFALSEKPVCSFKGHLDDVLDLSWSRSQHLLSSSMDKTVRLWDLETKACLKLFAHNDYVTCIQFNPMNDDYFISGSLDAKVRIWSIPDRQVVDWTDLHEMVTAACYTPDGQGAFIGSHKGNIRIYSAQDCKLTHTAQIDFQNKKKSHAKKITGFQFSPINPNEVLVTSADSRVRILDGQNLVHKFKGFRNTSSQIAASYSQDGKYVISASEDSQVYLWKREDHRHSSASSKRNIINTKSFEQFQCKDVSVAIPWPVGPTRGDSKRSSCGSPCSKANQSPQGSIESDASSMRYDDSPSPTYSWSWFDNASTHTLHNTAWGLVLVTAGLGGHIRAYQNFGLPRKVRRQTTLFGGPT